MSNLAPTLEYGIFNALLSKEINPNEIDKKGLSHIGQALHKAINALEDQKIEWTTKDVALYASEGLGIDRGRLQEYLANVDKNKIPSSTSIYRLLADRTALLEASNEIQRQFNSGDLDRSRIDSLLNARGSVRIELNTAAEDLSSGEPEAPSGPSISSLPKLSNCTNGVFGLWLVAGIPGVGKSTVAAQLAIDVGRYMPVVMYDYENTRRVLLYRHVQNFGLEKAKTLGKNWFIRESLRTLSKDLSRIKAPALLVIDSIQKINTSTDEYREGLENWIRRFEELRQSGYTVVLVSEVNRASYTGEPRLDAFKETGALEYAADVAIFLTERDNGMIGTVIVKNRHYPHKGLISIMERAKPFWFKEVELGI